MHRLIPNGIRFCFAKTNNHNNSILEIACGEKKVMKCGDVRTGRLWWRRIIIALRLAESCQTMCMIESGEKE